MATLIPDVSGDHDRIHLTVGQLVNDPFIRTRLIAGRGGLERPVTWAHTCEVSDPWNWMDNGDLLMTDGYGFPPAASEQVDFIRHLAGAGIAALTLAEGFVAPPLTPEAIAVADELSFPVLFTARSLPFVTIARVVAERNRDRSGSRASRVLRLYDVLRRSQSRELEDEADLLRLLGKELGAALNVVDIRFGRELVPSPVVLSDSLREATVGRAREHQGRLPGFSRLPTETGSLLLVPVGAGDEAALAVRVLKDQEHADLVLIQHTAMIVGLEVERRAALASRARDRGSTLVRRMLDGTIDPDQAYSQLCALGIGPGPWRVTACQRKGCSSTGPAEIPELFPRSTDHTAGGLALPEWAIVQTIVNGVHLVLVTDELFHSRELEEKLAASGAVAGASQPFASVSRFADAAREARWALEGAQESGAQFAVYGSHGATFMPRTVAEGEAAVRRLLGPVIDYDAAHDTELIRSLRVYFAVNRSWQEGARRLGIHKQTLVYRIRKVEELTGADLREFGTQAELYLALRTLDLLSTE
ncbi:PucR family transcriptional regulator [Nocardioides sp. NPDC058538]|uniref:PucR family transcriptional regulator n=1 Tax=Nocardioides sp. NPDC058538 TaxID=3346542 RepID=UPI00364C0D35